MSSFSAICGIDTMPVTVSGSLSSASAGFALSLEFCARFTLCMINCLWKLMFAYKTRGRRQVKSDKSRERGRERANTCST